MLEKILDEFLKICVESAFGRFSEVTSIKISGKIIKKNNLRRKSMQDFFRKHSENSSKNFLSDPCGHFLNILEFEC